MFPHGGIKAEPKQQQNGQKQNEISPFSLFFYPIEKKLRNGGAKEKVKI
jgi:hypothetical protein